MAAQCPRCELSDQLSSIKSILARQAYTSSQTSGMIFEDGSVTPVLGVTHYDNDELATLQIRIRNWVSEPLERNVNPAKYKKSTGWLMIVGAWVFSGLGMALGVPTLGWTLAPISLISGIVYLATRKSRLANAASSASDATDVSDSRRRADGWYCQRCNLLIAD